MKIKFFIGLGLLWIAMSVTVQAKRKMYDSYKGLVMAGYQGWFNAPDDGAGLGWRHYGGQKGFAPGTCTIDLWPDVSDYRKLYPTSFFFEDGSRAYTFSSHDESTVDTHFSWMKEYGLDGVFMQRFLSNVRNDKIRAHLDKVLASAMASADKYERAICVMYDLSGMHSGDEDFLLEDIRGIDERYALHDRRKNASYLYHNGKPLVAIWGAGFNDKRQYGLHEVGKIIQGLKAMGFSVMLGVPTYWRDLQDDTEPDGRLHELIRQCDIVMPWFVARYNETNYASFQSLIAKDLAWAKKNEVDYAPLCFPGFSWANMKGKGSLYIPRNKGSFFKKQLSTVIRLGAEMIYIAMFDEMDEGTAIFKCATCVPVSEGDTRFVPMEPETSSDHYLRLAGDAAKSLRKSLKNKRK